MQYQQQQMSQRQGINTVASTNRPQITVNGSRNPDLNENTSHQSQLQSVRSSPGHIMKQQQQQQPNVQPNSPMYNSSPLKMNPNMTGAPIVAENHQVMYGNYQANPVKISHNLSSEQHIQHPNHPPSAIIYTSEHGQGCMIISH